MSGGLDALVGEAMKAFASDHSYALAMTRQANSIQVQRDVGACRRELRAAEAAAVTACSTGPSYFICDVTGPCGTGQCRFAPPELKQLEVPHAPGSGERPMFSPYEDGYSLEAAVRPLYELRHG